MGRRGGWRGGGLRVLQMKPRKRLKRTGWNYSEDISGRLSIYLPSLLLLGTWRAMVEEPCTYEKQRMWDVISTCSTWLYEPIKQVWVHVVLLCTIRITIPGCVFLLDLAHVKIEYSLEKGSANEEYWAAVWSRSRPERMHLQINEVVEMRAYWICIRHSTRINGILYMLHISQCKRSRKKNLILAEDYTLNIHMALAWSTFSVSMDFNSVTLRHHFFLVLYGRSRSVSENTGAKNIVNMVFTTAVISPRNWNHTFERNPLGTYLDNGPIQTAGNTNHTVTVRLTSFKTIKIKTEK